MLSVSTMNKLRRALLPRFSPLRTSSLSSSTTSSLSSSTTSSLSSSTTSSLSSSSEPEIVIPDRIPRGPTDILKALAETVGTDHTAPHYKYHDDPWLIPYKNSMKRDYTLAKEAGRNAARFVLEKHPDLFVHNRIRMEPPINAFLPKTRYNESSVTVELLENLVENFQVEDAVEVHAILEEKGKEIPDGLEQDLMELIAFNNEDNSEDHLPESDGMVFNYTTKKDQNWKQGGLVDQLFAKGKASPTRRVALLLGLARYRMKERFEEVYKECLEHGDDLPVEVYNEIIKTSEKDVGVHEWMEQVKQVLIDMKVKRVAPNLDTLFSILAGLKWTSQMDKGRAYIPSCKFALATMAEFRILGIEPGLSSYKQLIQIFFKKFHDNKSMILKDIMREIEGKNMWPARHREDFFFFTEAMAVCVAVNDPGLAYKVHELLLTGDNVKLLGDFNRCIYYYRDLVNVVLRNEELSVAMDLYNQITPHTWSPPGNFYKDLLKQIHIQNGLNHVAKVYSDLRISEFGGSNLKEQYEITTQLLEILAANDPSKSEYGNLGEVWLDIAKRSLMTLQLKKNQRAHPLSANVLASRKCDLIIKIALREGCFETACQVLDFAIQERAVMPGSLEEESLTSLASNSMDLGEVDRVMDIITYASESGSEVALSLAEESVQKMQLSGSQKELLNKIFLSETKWTSI